MNGSWAELKEAVAAGGGFAGVFLVGRWLINWMSLRIDKRQAQLDAEDAALNMSWKEYRLHLERRMHRVEVHSEAYRLAFQHVSGALIRHDPQDPALAIAAHILAKAFPTDFTLATAMAAGALDKETGQ